MAKSYPHVLIVGAGMAGLTLAQHLRKNNMSFTVVERDLTSDARSQGWALSLFGPALAGLVAEMPQDLGPVDQTSHLHPLTLPAQFSFYDITKPDFRVGVISDDTGKIIRANRQRMRDWLLQGIDVQFGKRVIKIEEADDKVTAFFDDGTSESGDILVGAEGTRSVVRKHLLHGQDVMKPLPLGSLVGEVEVSGEDFAKQLSLAHSGYVIMNSTLHSGQQTAVFAALNKVSDDGNTGYWYFLLLWVDKDAPNTSEEKPSWTVTATKEELNAFAHEKTRSYPDHLRALIDSVPVEGYRSPGFQLQDVQLQEGQLPAGRVILIGDAAHSMTPFRGEAGVCAFTDALKLGSLLKEVRDSRLSPTGGEYKKLIKEFNTDMLKRGAWATEVSNPVLEDYGKYANYKFGTFGKDAAPMPAKPVVLESVQA